MPNQFDSVGAKFNAEVVNANFAPGETWDIEFATPKKTGAGRISGAEFGGGPAPRNWTVSLTRGGPAIDARLEKSGVNALSGLYRVGPGEGASKRYAELQPETVYFLRVTTDQPSGMKIGFYPPR